jgi:hypothetical protein
MIELDELDKLVGKVVCVVETEFATYFRRVPLDTELFDAVLWASEDYQWLERGRLFVSRCLWNVRGEEDGNARSAPSGAIVDAASGGTSSESEIWMCTWREDWPSVGVPGGRSCDLSPVVLFSFSASAASDSEEGG